MSPVSPQLVLDHRSHQGIAPSGWLLTQHGCEPHQQGGFTAAAAAAAPTAVAGGGNHSYCHPTGTLLQHPLLGFTTAGAAPAVGSSSCDSDSDGVLSLSSIELGVTPRFKSSGGAQNPGAKRKTQATGSSPAGICRKDSRELKLGDAERRQVQQKRGKQGEQGLTLSQIKAAALAAATIKQQEQQEVKGARKVAAAAAVGGAQSNSVRQLLAQRTARRQQQQQRNGDAAVDASGDLVLQGGRVQQRGRTARGRYVLDSVVTARPMEEQQQQPSVTDDGDDDGSSDDGRGGSKVGGSGLKAGAVVLEGTVCAVPADRLLPESNPPIRSSAAAAAKAAAAAAAAVAASPAVVPVEGHSAGNFLPMGCDYVSHNEHRTIGSPRLLGTSYALEHQGSIVGGSSLRRPPRRAAAVASVAAITAAVAAAEYSDGSDTGDTGDISSATESESSSGFTSGEESDSPPKKRAAYTTHSTGSNGGFLGLGANLARAHSTAAWAAKLNKSHNAASVLVESPHGGSGRSRGLPAVAAAAAGGSGFGGNNHQQQQGLGGGVIEPQGSNGRRYCSKRGTLRAAQQQQGQMAATTAATTTTATAAAGGGGGGGTAAGGSPSVGLCTPSSSQGSPSVSAKRKTRSRRTRVKPGSAAAAATAGGGGGGSPGSPGDVDVCTSQYRGVTRHRRSKRWEAHLWIKELGR